jgi:AcrR family transcriptional regulator
MAKNSSYHHGDLRAALIAAAGVEIERIGYENLSLRELAASLGVSRAAPYRHFADRRALLAAIAAEGFERLASIYRNATGKTPEKRLMFASDLFSALPLDPKLTEAATTCYEIFESLVAATLDDPDDRAIKATTIALMSSTYGFALLRMGDRIRPFMYGQLTPSDLVNAVLSMKVATLPGTDGRKLHKK